MPKRQPPEIKVVADSNALFPRDVTKLVSPKFMTFWKECRLLGKLRLVLPEVVIGERIYQLVAAAEKAMQNAAKNLETISKVTDKSGPSLPSRQEICTAVEKRFADWISENDVVIVATPIDRIDWKQVIADAIWRKSPFIPAGDNEDSEKGFRDRLILETLSEIIRTHPSQKHAFISGDKVLRETTMAQFSPDQLTAYEDIGGFSSYLKLLSESLNKEFVEAIMKAASAAFYTANDPECVYFQHKVAKSIAEKFFANLNFINEEKSSLLGNFGAPSLLSGSLTGLFESASDEKVFIDTTDFEARKAPNVFHWKTHIRFVRLFRQSTLGGFVGSLDLLGERVRVAKFDVSWKASVDDEERFSNPTVTDIKLVDKSVEGALFNKVKYGFETDRPSAQK